MKFSKVVLVLLGSAAIATSCKRNENVYVTPVIDTPKPGGPDTSAVSYILTGDVSANKSLSNDKVWTLKGYVYVKSGATLTIPAGTIIRSDVVDKGALIIEPGGKIMAMGTASAPVVFTSGQVKGQRRPGDWGGIIMLGKATTNRPTSPAPVIEGGVDRTYGGSDDNDNSGEMHYVRIEFAGIAAAPNSEINGLTFGGVGAGTQIDHIQVSYANDDAYEWFGGTVNCHHMIAWAASDDDYDCDFGFRGNLQYGISIKHPQYADIGDASNGIELDNDGTGTSAQPYTRPVFSNFTFVGSNSRANTQSNHNFAMRIRRSGRVVVRNSAIVGFQKGGLSLESAATSDAFVNGQSEFKNNYIGGVINPFIGGSGSTLTNAQLEAFALANGNVKVDSVGALKFTDAMSLKKPNVMPMNGSMLLSGGIVPSFDGVLANAFFAQANFIGAIGTEDWTAGWTNWDPNNADY